jgi:hypothetical protein
LENVQEWSATVQQRLSTDWSAEVSYEGTHAIHLDQFIDANAPALPQGSLAGLSLQERRRFPQWGILGTWAPLGYGRYNGLAATLRNNSWHGLTLLSSFTFAKNIVSSLLGVSDQGNQSYQVPYLWRGPGQLTPRLRMVNSFAYDLPFRFGTSGVVSTLAGGWNISGIVDMTTGTPNQVTTDDLSGTGYGVMPNRICDARNVPGGRGRLMWFNTGCFVEPAFGTWGNSNFGVYEDPGINNWNLKLSKTIPTRLPAENGRIVVRADLLNAWNHTQWGSASNSTLQSGNINSGRILTTRPPRQIQFSISYRF